MEGLFKECLDSIEQFLIGLLFLVTLKKKSYRSPLMFDIVGQSITHFKKISVAQIVSCISLLKSRCILCLLGGIHKPLVLMTMLIGDSGVPFPMFEDKMKSLLSVGTGVYL